MSQFRWIYAALIVLLQACAAGVSSDAADGVKAEQDALASEDPCAAVRCKQGFMCESDGCTTQCVPVPKGYCQVDADCRLVADYCGGCNCRILGPGESLPKCDHPVACFVDPCLQAEPPVCQDGRCVGAER